jgi:hypothetical protein
MPVAQSCLADNTYYYADFSALLATYLIVRRLWCEHRAVTDKTQVAILAGTADDVGAHIYHRP